MNLENPNRTPRETPDDEYRTDPPYTRTMAIVRWSLLGALSVFAAVMILTYLGFTPWAAATGVSQQYHCPMHPTYITGQPGDCPICGMSLVPISSGDSGQATATAQPATQDHQATPGKAQPGRYTCPMHPDVVSDEPGRCPECGMFLIPVEEPVTPADEQGGPVGSEVPGLVPVTIAPERLQLIGLKTGRVERRSLGGELRLVGFVSPDETRVASVHVRVSGWVSKLFVNQTGQYVGAGDPLLSIYSQDLYRAEQDLIVARDAARQSDGDSLLVGLRAQVLGAARDKLRLLGLSEAEIADVEAADFPGQEMVLRSPVSGYVLDKSVYEEQFVSPESDLFTIADLSRIWVQVDVYEQDMNVIAAGLPVEMRLTSFPGEVFKGRISFVYPSVSEKTRTLKVRLEFPNPDLRLRPGMYAEIHVDHDHGNRLAVPSSAVLDGGETQYAFVVHDGTHFEPRLLNLGQRADDWVEVLEGLHEGEVVVTSANFLIDSESRLKAAITGMGGGQAATGAEHAH